MRYSKDKTINDTVKELLKTDEWQLKKGGSHHRIEHVQSHRVFTIPGSSSDRRASLNRLHQPTREYGVQVC